MTTQVNEFSIDLPLTSAVPPMSPPVDYVMNNGYDTAPVGVMSASGAGDDAAIAIGDIAANDPTMDPSKITVYAGNISPVSYSGSDPISCFDVVFTVGINCDGVSKTYQVVKRIGIDKCKIAAQASANAPVSVVESVKETIQQTKPVISEVQKFRRLAGLD